jgi:hypothetical protein
MKSETIKKLEFKARSLRNRCFLRKAYSLPTESLEFKAMAFENLVKILTMASQEDNEMSSSPVLIPVIQTEEYQTRIKRLTRQFIHKLKEAPPSLSDEDSFWTSLYPRDWNSSNEINIKIEIRDEFYQGISNFKEKASMQGDVQEALIARLHTDPQFKCGNWMVKNLSGHTLCYKFTTHAINSI